MAEDQKDRCIQYLVERNHKNELTKKAMVLVLEDFITRQKSLEERLESVLSEQSAVRAELLEKDRRFKATECENRTLREQLDYTKAERCGKKHQRVRKNPSGGTEKQEPDSNDEKGDYDRMEDSLRTDSVDIACPQAASVASSRQERDLSNHPDIYKRTDVVSTYHSVISTVKLYGGSTWEFIGIFFKNIFNGCKDYANTVSGKLAMDTCQR